MKCKSIDIIKPLLYNIGKMLNSVLHPCTQIRYVVILDCASFVHHWFSNESLNYSVIWFVDIRKLVDSGIIWPSRESGWPAFEWLCVLESGRAMCALWTKHLSSTRFRLKKSAFPLTHLPQLSLPLFLSLSHSFIWHLAARLQRTGAPIRLGNL